MNKLKNSVLWWIFCVSCLVLSSCKLEDPVFKGMQSLSVSSVSASEVLLEGEGLFYNPNGMSLTIQEMNVKLFVNNEEMGVCHQELNQKIESKSDFTVPIKVKFPSDKLYKNLFQGLLGMLTKQEYEVRYIGEVKMKAYGISFTVPIDDKKKVKF
ncbi:MAG: hypothetical protein OHK0038_21330 [Flammeovirgaceae bacterium]